MVTFAMLYFAYGANLCKELIEGRCPGVIPLTAAALEDYRLAFVGSSRRWEGGGVATIIRAEGSRVFGALYEVRRVHEVALDRYEGVPNFYAKQFVPIDGKSALTYVNVLADENPPCKSYIETIRKGYADWGHPTALLDAIETID